MQKLHCLAYCLFPLAFIQFSCDKNDGVDDMPPVLSITPIDINSVAHVIPFGEDLSAAQKNPAFEYIVDNANEEVKSCSSGYVDKIIENDGFSDFEIHIKPSSGSEWIIIYDHVKNISLLKGDKVEPETLLGIVGDGNRTELQINKNELAYCPLQFRTNEFIQLHNTVSDNWCLLETVVP